MKKKSLFLFISTILIIIIVNLYLSINRMSREDLKVEYVEKSRNIETQIMRKGADNANLNEVIAINQGAKKEDYALLCTELKKKHFSNIDELIDPNIDLYKSVSYIENKIELMREVANNIVLITPIGLNACLLDDYYDYLTTLMDALKDKKLKRDQKRKVASDIVESAIVFSTVSVMMSLSIVRELIERNFINSDFLYECSDYMKKINDNYEYYESGKINEINFRDEKNKLTDDASSLLLSIQRTLQ